MSAPTTPPANFHAVIMAGGIGSRFWPFSRNQKPKQFLDVLGMGQTLIQMTYERLLALTLPENIWVVSHQDYESLIREQLPQLRPDRTLLEPSRKNTAACILWASRHIAAVDSKATMFIAPSDHLITRQAAFQSSVQTAQEHILQFPDDLITFGIKASRPDTGYGYICYDQNPSANGVQRVIKFVEKPDQSTAEQYLASGNYVWNSGMFMWKNETIDKNLSQWCPEVYHCFDAYSVGMNPEAVYQQCPSISIDYAVMEKTQHAMVLPVDLGWSDLGTWASLFELLPKDPQHNALIGTHVHLRNSADCLVRNEENKLLALQNVHNLIVVNTPQALLICNKSEEQAIKQMVNHLQEIYGTQAL